MADLPFVNIPHHGGEFQEFQKTYFFHIKRKWKTSVLYGVIAMFFVAGISLIMPLEYRAYTQVLILPKNIAEIDSYTSARASELVGENLQKLILTSSFFELVQMVAGDKMNVNYFPADSKARANKWKRLVKAEVVPGTSLFKVSAYHKDKAQARVILQAVVDALSTRGGSYTGFDVEIKQVDSIFITDYPVRPNILANAALGFLVGVLVGALYAIYDGERMTKL